MKMRIILAAVGIVCGFSRSVFASCPVYPNTTLVIRAEIGDLQIEAPSREPVVDIRWFFRAE